jgi:hypothetical protein
MASAWMDNINRLAAWRSASLSSAVWRLCNNLKNKLNIDTFYFMISFVFCFVFSNQSFPAGGGAQPIFERPATAAS